jgi:transcriptional regulator with XRE-family HTH domain
MARPENSLEYTSTGELYRGSLIRELRWKKRLSRGRMAKLLGCNPDSLSKVETNGVNPSEQMLSKIAEVLEVPLESFTKAPVHPRILSKKAAQTVAQPQVVSPLASRPSTTPQSSREAVLKLLEAAGVASDDALEGYELVKIEDGETEKEGKDARTKEPGGWQAVTAGAGAFGAGVGLGAILLRSKTGQQETDTASQQHGQDIGLLVKQIVAEAQLLPEKERLAGRLIEEHARAVCHVLATEQDQQRR